LWFDREFEVTTLQKSFQLLADLQTIQIEDFQLIATMTTKLLADDMPWLQADPILHWCLCRNPGSQPMAVD
jgi:hypothetical protein